jgi:hypothetical protein
MFCKQHLNFRWTEDRSVRIASVVAEIRSKHLPNINLKTILQVGEGGMEF